MFFIMILMMTIHCFLMIRLYIQLYPVAFCSTVPCNYIWHFAVFISSSCILQYLCAPKLHFVVLQSLQFEVAFCSNVLNLSASFQRNVVPQQGRIQPLLKGGGSNKTKLKKKNLQKGLFVQTLNMGDLKGIATLMDPNVDPPLL